jgi:hypothetical protein
LEVKIHILFYGTEDNLRKTAHKLNQVITGCGLTISVKKTKSMAFKGRDRIRRKIVIHTRVIEKVNPFNCLGNLISYKNEMDIENKLNSYLRITDIINNAFRPKKTPKKTRIKLYNTLALPTLLYGSESWTIKARDARRLTSAEIKCVRRTAGYTCTDHKTYIQIG